MNKYIVHDGVDCENHFCDTEEEAKDKLKDFIESSLDGSEWCYGVDDSFVAEIKFVVRKRPIAKANIDDYQLKSGITDWADMEIEAFPPNEAE